MFEQNNKATAKLIILVSYVFNITIEAKHNLRKFNFSNISIHNYSSYRMRISH